MNKTIVCTPIVGNAPKMDTLKLVFTSHLESRRVIDCAHSACYMDGAYLVRYIAHNRGTYLSAMGSVMESYS